MQTFLPYPSFASSAAVLDDRRLGKQRVEALQILRALHLEDYGWRSHPAVLMWRGHTGALVAYGLAVVDEWLARARADSTGALIAEFARPQRARREADLPERERPPWLGWEALHRSHRSALLRKDPGHYRSCFAGTPADLGYVWPEPPAAPEQPAPVSAWVVRAADPAAVERFRRAGLVGPPVELATADASPKRRRQLQLFCEHARPGQPLVVPDDGGLLLGEVTGDPAAAPGPALACVRAVRWLGRLRRDQLCRPYQLQDPRWVFPLRGEPAVEAATRASAGARTGPSGSGQTDGDRKPAQGIAGPAAHPAEGAVVDREAMLLGTPGPLRDALVAAALRGDKTATTCLPVLYELEGVQPPAAGSTARLLDSAGEAVARVVYTRVEQVPLAAVGPDVAQAEGEGFASVADWRAGHERFWSRFLPRVRAFVGDPAWAMTDATPVLVQWFRLCDPCSAGRAG